MWYVMCDDDDYSMTMRHLIIICDVKLYKYHFSIQLTSLEEDKAKILTANCALAQENVDREPEIIERKSRLSEMTEEAKELCTVLQEKLGVLSM